MLVAAAMDLVGAAATQSLLSLAPDEQLQSLVDRHGIRGRFVLVEGSPRSDSDGNKAGRMERHLAAIGADGRATVVIGDTVDDHEAAARLVGAAGRQFAGAQESQPKWVTDELATVRARLEGQLDRVRSELSQHLSEHRKTEARLRQRVVPGLGPLTTPRWVHDPEFDLDNHLRRAAIPSPGSLRELAEFVGDFASRLLERSKPLWEIALVEGLEGGKLAVVTKIHHASMDGGRVVALLLGQLFEQRTYLSGDHFFSHGATYAGHALGSATALAVIPIYQEDNLVERSAEMGEYLLEKARSLEEKHPSVGDVRGLGLFVGLELVKNKATREPLTPVNAKILPGSNPKLEVAKKLGEMGMMAMAANPVNVIALAPPLIVTRDEIDEGIAIMDKALEAADAYTE